MDTTEPRLLTTGRMAELLGVPRYRIDYLLATRRHIRPSAWAGGARLYDRKALAQVRYQLNLLSARRGRKGRA